jgi:hypothetical protein
MALTQVTGPYPIFTDLDGTPLDDGYLYIGEINQDPEQNPIQVFWDANLTIAATQPIRTSNGYAYRNGTPALLYTAGEFSITIRNKREEFVLYSPVGYGFDPAAVSASVVKNDFTGDGVEVDFVLSASPSTILATNVFINGVYQEKDSYTLSGNTITFSIAPPLSSSIEILTNETGIINSGNANDISYTLTAPGATLQSVQTKLEQYVSVMDFGAVGDNVANDTAAIQAAIDYAAPLGKMVFIPSGTYKITKLTLPQQAGGIEIVGEARCDANSLSSGNYVGTVLISADTTGDIISADGGVSYENRNVKISNLSLRCATSGYAIYLKNCLEQTQLTNLTIFNSNTSGNGIGLESCWVGCLVSNCIITGSATSATGYGIKIFNDQLAGGYLIENTTAANFGTGMYFGDLVYQCIALNSAAEGCYFGFTVDDSANVQIDNCHTEFSKINGIYLISSAATQITSCSFVNDGTDTVVGFAKAAIYVVGSVSNVNQNLSIKSCYFINIPSDAAAVQIENSQYAQGVIDGNVMNALAGSTNNTGIIIAGPNIENWAVINNSGDIAVKYSPTVGFKIFTPSVGGLTNITFNATPVNPAFAPNNCLFVDAGTTKLSYKDSSGVTNALY